MRVLFFSALIVLIACEKDEFSLEDGQNELPPATEEAVDIIACYIDNETYIDKRGRVNATYYTVTNFFSLSHHIEPVKFSLYVEEMTGTGTYEFVNAGDEYLVYYGDTCSIKDGGVNVVEVSKFITGPEGVISGTFEIDLINDEGTERLIRNGRFDFNLGTVN